MICKSILNINLDTKEVTKDTILIQLKKLNLSQVSVKDLKVFAFENGETDWIIARNLEEAKNYYARIIGFEEMAECNITELKEWNSEVMMLETMEKQYDGTYFKIDNMLNVAIEMYGSGYNGATVIATTCTG
ncbi:hypothetical protein FDE94_14985 [Clostridium botulinum]|nr:hypothetical protein [Clostridium botulinum]